METDTRWHDQLTIPTLLRHARTVYGGAMRRALAVAGYDDIPGNGLYIIGGLAFGAGVAIGELTVGLRVSKQAAGQLVDTLVLRGYLDRRTDEADRRKLIVTLTERGEAAADIQRQAREQVDAALTEAVGAEVVQAMRVGLAKLVEIDQRGWEEAVARPD